jgi:hypothetical protein
MDFLKPYTGWSVSLWQDRIHGKYQTHEVTVEQARAVRLSNIMEDARHHAASKIDLEEGVKTQG